MIRPEDYDLTEEEAEEKYNEFLKIRSKLFALKWQFRKLLTDDYIRDRYSHEKLYEGGGL